MKKFLSVFLIIISCVFFAGCTAKDSVIRIHIRANSNCTFDQEVKLIVRDKIVDYITPLIEDCESSNEVKIVLEDNLKNIEKVADKILLENNCDYISSAEINNEYFPTRQYESVSFPADYYDALIIKLGSGKGDNWWCVAYPPLCFMGDADSNEIQYKSKLVELLKNILG